VRTRYLILLLLIWLPHGALAAPISCSYDAKLQAWTLQAERVPLSDLLSTLAARAGFEVVGPYPTGSLVSIDLSQAPLERILKRILKPWSYGLIYRGERLERVIFFASVPNQRSAASSALPSEPPEEEAEEPSPAPPPHAPPRFFPGGPPDELLKWTHHPDPERRRQAFEALAPMRAEPRVRQRLQEGLHDPDPRVRTQVLMILGQWARPAPNPYPEQVPEGEEQLDQGQEEE
jgi:hypothetical protein